VESSGPDADPERMARLIGFLLIAAAIGLVVSRVVLSPSDVRMEGEMLVVDADQLEGRFYVGGPFSGTFMVFGGLGERLPNSVTDVILAGLPIDDARLIHSRFPDFHRCSSPGAESAKMRVQDLTFVAQNRGIARTLSKVIDLHGERIRSGGERTCVSVSGQQLSLASVKIKEPPVDITGEVSPMFADLDVYLAEAATIEDCETLLR
jgi:hypothetical protein